MTKIKPYYENEVKRVTNIIKNTEYDFLFALAADSHLDNSLPDTLCNIKTIDDKVNFKCLVHLGDFLNGNIPRNYTKEILNSQMQDFKNSLNGCFFPVQGNHDGFIDQEKHMTTDMAINEDWFEATKFVCEYKNVSRPDNKPYFYIDYPEEKIRMIILCSFYYNGFENGEIFKKEYGIDLAQARWLKDEALNISGEWSVMLFSHDTPFSEFSEELLFKKNDKINGNLVLETLLERKKQHGFNVPAWFIGHFHGDFIKNLYGINFVLIGSQTAYVPQLWDMPENGMYFKRILNTETEDLWDCAMLDKKHRKLKLIRFGAGCDREISY